MHITVPMSFKVTGTPKNHRNVSETIVKKFETFEIKTLSRYEAPIAIKGLDTDIKNFGDHTRWYENSNWIEEKNFTTSNHDKFLENFNENFNSSKCYKINEAIKNGRLCFGFFDDLKLSFKSSNNEQDYGDIKTLALFDEKNFRSIESTDYNERHEYYTKMFNEMLIIENSLYSKCEVPLIYKLGVQGYSKTVIGTHTSLGMRKYYNNSEFFSFNNLDNIDREDILTSINHDITMPDILIPEAADFPDDVYSLMGTVKLALGEKFYVNLSYMTEDQGKTWFSMRTVFENTLKELVSNAMELPEDSIEAVALSLQKFINEVRDQDLYEKNAQLEEKISVIIEASDQVIKRWNNRSISFDNIVP